MSSSITKYYEQNAGANARKGFKFQDYVGLYYMLYYYKKDMKFSVLFETRDDIEALTQIENNKIQVKSYNYTIKKIHKAGKDKKSTYEKLMDKSNGEYNRYILSCCGFNNNEHLKYLSKTEFEIDNVYKITGHKEFHFDDKFNIHIVPFSDNNENAEYYVLGYAKNKKYGKVINLDDHINKLVKRVGELGEYKIECESDYKRKRMTTEDLQKIEDINGKLQKKDIILNALALETNHDYVDKIRIKIHSIDANPDPILRKLDDYKLPDIEDMKYADYFLSLYDDISSTYPILDKKLILAWAINKYIEEVES